MRQVSDKDAVSSWRDPASDSHARLRIDVLGGLAVSFAGQPVELSSRKAKALVAYLACSPNGVASREHLVGLLWSESSEDKARASLRQVLRALRQSFQDTGFDGFDAGRSDVYLRPGGVSLDLAEVIAAVEDGRVPPARIEQEGIA